MGIRQLREKNLYYTQIGEELGIDPRTAAKYCNDAPPAESRPEPPGIPESHKEFIANRCRLIGANSTRSCVTARFACSIQQQTSLTQLLISFAVDAASRTRR